MFTDHLDCNVDICPLTIYIVMAANDDVTFMNRDADYFIIVTFAEDVRSRKLSSVTVVKLSDCLSPNI